LPQLATVLLRHRPCHFVYFPQLIFFSPPPPPPPPRLRQNKANKQTKSLTTICFNSLQSAGNENFDLKFKQFFLFFAGFTLEQAESITYTFTQLMNDALKEQRKYCVEKAALVGFSAMQIQIYFRIIRPKICHFKLYCH